MVHAPAIESNVCIRASEVKLRLSALRLLRLLFLHSLLGGLFRFLGRLRCFLSGSLCGARGLCYPLIGPLGEAVARFFFGAAKRGAGVAAASVTSGM